MWTRMRRLLRTLLLRLAAWLDDAPARVSSSGPPPHWLERVRRAQFVSSGDAPAPLPVTREVPRVGVPRVVARDPLPVARVTAPAILTPVSLHVPHPAVDASIAKPRSAERSAEHGTEHNSERHTERSTAERHTKRSADHDTERHAERSAERSAGFQPAGPPASSRPVAALGRRPVETSLTCHTARVESGLEARSPKNTWPKLEIGPAGSRRSGRLEAGAPLKRYVTPLGAPAAGRPVLRPLAGTGGPPVDLPASGRRASETANADPDIENHWPDLPDAGDDVIASFDDAEHLRRIDAEQRGAAWSE